MLSGCMASDPSLAPTASFASGVSGSGEFAMALPDTVSVLPASSGQGAVQVGYAEPAELSASSFAGSEPSAAVAPGAFPPPPKSGATARSSLSGEQVLLAPLPASLSPRTRPFQLPPVDGGGEEVNRLIEKYAKLYDVPVNLVRRVVRRESTFNPKAYNNGHWGLMQIKHATARGMGYRGQARGLLDAETNLKYAVRYLRGAWMVAEGNPDLADRLYQTGYYYHAKRKGLLEETGLGRDRKRRRMAAEDEAAGMAGLL